MLPPSDNLSCVIAHIQLLLPLFAYHRIGAVLVFLMQTGFAMLEVGSVNAKNTRNILLKVSNCAVEKS